MLYITYTRRRSFRDGLLLGDVFNGKTAVDPRLQPTVERLSTLKSIAAQFIYDRIDCLIIIAVNGDCSVVIERKRKRARE